MGGGNELWSGRLETGIFHEVFFFFLIQYMLQLPALTRVGYEAQTCHACLGKTAAGSSVCTSAAAAP